MDNPYYEKDGKRYTRVSRIIDFFAPPDLVEWKMDTGRKEAGRISRAALKIGSRVDDLITENWQNPKVGKKDGLEVQSCLQAWQAWLKDYQPKELKFHETVYDEEAMVAGTYDFMWGDILVDIKTSRNVKPYHFFQLGAYGGMMKPHPEKLAILRLDKSLGIYEFVESRKVGLDPLDCWLAFKGLQRAYKVYNQADSALNPPKGQKEQENDTDISTQQITAADREI